MPRNKMSFNKVGRVVRRAGQVGAMAVLAITLTLQPIGGAVANAVDYNAEISQHDAEIQRLQQDIDNYNAKATEKGQQADTLENRISDLKGQQANIQNQISLSDVKREKLEAEIAHNEDDIKAQIKALSDNLTEQYYSGQTTTLDILLNSNSVSDYVDRQTRQSTITDSIKKTVAKVKQTKAQLESDKKEVEQVIKEHQSQKDQLAANQAEQQTLLNQTRGDEAKYQQLQQSTQAEMAQVQTRRQNAIAALKRQQEEMRRQREAASAQQNSGSNNSGSSSGNSSNSGSTVNYGQSGTKRGNFEFSSEFSIGGCGTGGYPYCGRQGSYTDPWNMYNRECVSWAAWRVTHGYGKVIPGYPRNSGKGHGNAVNWPIYSGGRVVNNPQPGDVAIIGTNIIPVTGHAMVVESVGSDGWVTVSQYNWTPGIYSKMKIRGTAITYLRF